MMWKEGSEKELSEVYEPGVPDPSGGSVFDATPRIPRQVPNKACELERLRGGRTPAKDCEKSGSALEVSV